MALNRAEDEVRQSATSTVALTKEQGSLVQ
jgi:hypothetical protein